MRKKKEGEGVLSETRYVIFGAGMYGRMALKKYDGQIECFIDNNEKMIGTKVSGVPIISVTDFLSDTKGCQVIIASGAAPVMARQLESAGFYDYIIYTGEDTRYYKTDELIYNPYHDNAENRGKTESDYNSMMETSLMVKSVNEYVRAMDGQVPLFSLVEIETKNKCNGNCDFCPVSRGNDTRKETYMSDDTFKKIIDELSEMDYSGRLTLFGNNEPLLDPKIIERHRYAREKVPKAIMHLYTNGTLLTVEKFEQLMQYLDELIIDNYHPELKLIRPCMEIEKLCEECPEYKKKATIVIRDPHEILSSRGGDAPNRKEISDFGDDSCTQPFKQLEIRSEGKCSLCCADPLGKVTLGDVTNNTLKEIWYGDEYKRIREQITKGRRHVGHCKKCDFFDL